MGKEMAHESREHRGRVVLVGESIVDLVAEGDPGPPDVVERVEAHAGGAIANVAVAAARFGARAELVGVVGDDRFGRWLAKRLAAEGVDVEGLVPVSGRAAQRNIVTLSEGGQPSYDMLGEAPWEAAAGEVGTRLGATLASGPPGVLYHGSDELPHGAARAVVARAVAAARTAGWIVMFEPKFLESAWVDRSEMLEATREAVRAADVVKANFQEAAELAGTGDPAAAAAEIATVCGGAAIVTRGAAGFLCSFAGREPARHRAAAAAAVDATGAGDALAGVFAAAVARAGHVGAIADVAALAARVAAGVTEAIGATRGLPGPLDARAALDASLRSA